MPSASSAKSVKTPSVPPADTRPPTTTATMKTTKNAVTVTATNVDCPAAAVAAAVADATNSVTVTSATTTTSCAAGATSIVAGGSSASGSSCSVATPQANTSVENHASTGVSTPIKQTLVIIEHKIRNLEKRKTKLESYRAIQASGKELSSDQKQAVSKYDEVMQCLEFARDLTKQMMQLSNNAEKEQKKLARREAIVRAQAEALKIREVLTIQNILNQFENEMVREDFLNGTNGATKLEENDMNMLEKFFIDVNVRRQTSPEDPPFLVSAQKAADLLSFTIDGRPKPYYDTTFENLRRIFQSIQDCGYFDQAGKVEATEEENVAEGEDMEQAGNEEDNDDMQATDEPEVAMEMVTEEMVQMQISQGQQDLVVLTEVQQFEAPSAAAVPAPAFPQAAPLLQAPQVQPAALLGAGQMPPPQAQLQRPVLVSSVVPAAAVAPAGMVSQQGPQVAQVPPNAVPPNAANAIHGGHFPPTTVRAVEQGYYKQHQYIQQMRPLAEVIGSTNFYFLQESELDSPDIVAPGGFTTSEGQPVAAVITGSGVLSQQSPAGVPQQLIQAQQQPQPAQQPQIALSQQTGLPSKSQPGTAPNITSQTFTNPSFPPIVPQQAPPMFQPAVVQAVDMTNATQQQPPPQLQPVVYPPQSSAGGVPGGIPIQSLLATPQAVVSQQQAQPQLMNSMVDSQTVADVMSQQAAANIVNLMSGPGGVSVAMPAFVPSKFQQPPQGATMVSVHPPTITQMPAKDPLEAIQQQSQQQTNELKHSQMDDLKENRGPKNDSSQDWDAHEPHVQQKSHTQALSSRPDDESNQWSNEVTTSSTNSSKHDWNSNYDNQNDSNTWKSMSNDAYGGRNAGGGRNNYNNRGSGGGSGRGGPGLRGNNAGGGGGNGGPPSNGYRGRSNNYQQQQNNRNAGMYFRNNDGGYYQNQNGNGGGGGYGNKDTSNNYVSGGPNNNYRPRGTVPPNSRQQGGPRLGGPPNSGNGPSQSQSNRNSAGGAGGQNPNRSSNVGGGNMSTNPNARSGRNNPGNTYGSSRPPPSNNVRQQDINA